MNKQDKHEHDDDTQAQAETLRHDDDAAELRELAGRIRTRLVAGFVADEEGSGA